MSDQIQIQIGTAKNVDSVNVDQNLNISLQSSTKELLSYNESSVIDVSALFDAERQESEVYRVYGTIDFMSVINGLPLAYSGLTNFFTPVRLGSELNNEVKNVLNSFDVYLCYPSTGNTSATTTTFVRNYVVISKLINVELYKAGYSKNIFYNHIHAFDFNIDFNIEGLRDSFGKPINRFYLFFNYKPTTNGLGVMETVSGLTLNGNTFNGITAIPYTIYNVGDVIEGDFVSYVNTNYEEELIDRMGYYITFPYQGSSLEFKYNPFLPIKVRDFDDEISSANISGGTESDIEIPDYAIPIDNDGNYVWKEILQNGYIDPISGNGVDYPFINKRHYIFNKILLGVVPNINNPHTQQVFSEIRFANNRNLYTKPSSDLNKLGNKCA